MKSKPPSERSAPPVANHYPSFVLYHLRSSYLHSIKDGVGERLININSNALNNPAFRVTGWFHSGADKRTYSPPIPTAIASDYFQVPPRSAGLGGSIATGAGDDDDEFGGIVTGVGSNDTVGPAPHRRRRRKEQLRERDQDSSDLSDESDDDRDIPQRAVSQIKFQKMPVRARAGSSPLRSPGSRNGPDLLVTSPSRPPDSRLRRGSLGTIDVPKSRPRGDTITSSEMSSENESLDPSVFRRKQINPPRNRKAGRMIHEDIVEERSDFENDDQDDADSSDDSGELSSEFGSAGSNSFLGADTAPIASPITSDGPTHLTQQSSPRKNKQGAQDQLSELPPPRPISTILPKSALTMALKGPDKKDQNFLVRYNAVSAKHEKTGLNIKIYTPFSSKPTKPIELKLRKISEENRPVIVADLIGLALFTYQEEKIEPPLDDSKADVNRWTLRMVEDDEVDYDFPALTRAKPISDFTSNNNRAATGRFRGTPWDEFALVEATEQEYQENEKITPFHGRKNDSTPSAPSALAVEDKASTPLGQLKPQLPPPSMMSTHMVHSNPITRGNNFNPIANPKESGQPMDAPQSSGPQTAQRTGQNTILTIHFSDEHLNQRTTKVEVTTDTYLDEVFTSVCKKLGVDKGLYVLKVHNTPTVAPNDRTVESLKGHADLDLQRRRFVGDGAFGLAGSPGSSSPNAPLFIPPPLAALGAKKGKKDQRQQMQLANMGYSVAAQPDSAFSLANAAGTFKRWHVWRKTPIAFSSASPRVIALDGDFLYIMSNEVGGGGGGRAGATDAGTGAKSTRLEAAPTKTTTVHFSSIIGCKVSKRHPRMFSIIVFRERQPKRYDFGAPDHKTAAEIVREVLSMTETAGAML
jgi:target of rapamycin complex 2 subunit MAPKAP1